MVCVIFIVFHLVSFIKKMIIENPFDIKTIPILIFYGLISQPE